MGLARDCPRFVLGAVLSAVVTWTPSVAPGQSKHPVSGTISASPPRPAQPVIWPPLCTQVQPGSTPCIEVILQKKAKENGGIIGISNDVLLTISTVLLAIFTFVLAIATFLVWHATRGLLEAARVQAVDLKTSLRIGRMSANAARESAKISRQTLEVTQRPVMAIEGVDCCLAPASGTKGEDVLEIVARWKNCGPVFAVDCVVEASYLRSTKPGSWAELKALDLSAGGILVAPGGEIDCAPLKISTVDLVKLNAGVMQLALWVRCSYASHLTKAGSKSPFETRYGYAIETMSNPALWRSGVVKDVRFRILAGGGDSL
jgi:hypothetical protein